MRDRIKELEGVLDEILNPIKYMKLRLKEGEQLNTLYVNDLANSANYIRTIAKTALNKKQK